MTDLDKLAEAAKLVHDNISSVAVAAKDPARLETVRSTIYVNAVLGLGCSPEEAEAYADGTSEKTFVQAMSEHMAAQQKAAFRKARDDAFREAAKLAEGYPAETHGSLVADPYHAAKQAAEEIKTAITALIEGSNSDT